MSKISAYALVKVNRAIDFGEITPGCNLSVIGLREGIAAKLGECRRQEGNKKKLTNASFSCP